MHGELHVNVCNYFLKRRVRGIYLLSKHIERCVLQPFHGIVYFPNVLLKLAWWCDNICLEKYWEHNRACI